MVPQKIVTRTTEGGNFQQRVSRQSQMFLSGAETSHVAAPVCARVKAVGGQRRGRTRAGADVSWQLRVADLRGHIVRLPALQFLPHQPLHLLPVGVRVPPQSLILTDGNKLDTFMCICLQQHS